MTKVSAPETAAPGLDIPTDGDQITLAGDVAHAHRKPGKPGGLLPLVYAYDFAAVLRHTSFHLKAEACLSVANISCALFNYKSIRPHDIHHTKMNKTILARLRARNTD